MLLSTDPSSPLQPARFTRRRFERMIEAGIFDEDDRIELLNGVLVAMTPQGVRHQSAIRRLNRILVELCGAEADVGPQLPFAATADSMLEPDLCVTPAGIGDHAFADRALLVVEVAETSLLKDRTDKAAIYATAGVPEYWVVDVKARLVEIYTDPLDDHFATSRTVRPGERVELLTLPGRFVAIADIFAG